MQPRPLPHAARRRGVAACVAAGLFLAGCAGPALRDGPDPHPPPNLLQVPDAEPRIEPIRPGGPNKPYSVAGRSYVPLPADAPLAEQGLATWYGRQFSGKPTASGEPYDMYAMTAAHPTLPIPSYVRIRNPANGREVVVRVNDRGPFHDGRIVDVSYTAALKLDILRGATPVELERITPDAIRTGAWRREPGSATVPAAPAAEPAAVPPAATIAAVPAAEAVPVAVDPPTASEVPAAPTAVSKDAGALPLPGRGFWVQLGAFRAHDGALALQKQVDASVDGGGPRAAVFDESSLFRVQAGPFASRDEARQAAERFRAALGLVPVIVERR